MDYNYKNRLFNNNLKHRNSIHEIVLSNKSDYIKLYCIKQQHAINSLYKQARARDKETINVTTCPNLKTDLENSLASLLSVFQRGLYVWQLIYPLKHYDDIVILILIIKCPNFRA